MDLPPPFYAVRTEDQEGSCVLRGVRLEHPHLSDAANGGEGTSKGGGRPRRWSRSNEYDSHLLREPRRHGGRGGSDHAEPQTHLRESFRSRRHWGDWCGRGSMTRGSADSSWVQGISKRHREALCGNDG